VNGIGHASGALTVPVKTQIANHLARFTTFKASDLIVVLAGNNDAFTQFGIFAAAAAQIQANAGAGKITADQANVLLFQAETAGLAAMKVAALELSSYVQSEILGKGGKYVAVLTPLDAAVTPFGASVPASARPVLTALTDNFNQWLRDGLTGQPVQIIGLDGMLKNLIANPTAAGFANVTVPTCDATKISAITGGQITDGSSLFCNSTAGAPYNGIRAGADVTTWLFADGVHPTPAGHKAFSDYVAQQLKSFGWI
jgi:phospholipase/lecithinase/hemolysin